jgi:uncharacterized protein (DUF433 family)
MRATAHAPPVTNPMRRNLFFNPSAPMVSLMLDWSQCPVVERGPGKSRCMWRFKATHVPVTLLFENLEDGATVNDFLDWYPGVTREQVVAVLAFAERSLIEA